MGHSNKFGHFIIKPKKQKAPFPTTEKRYRIRHFKNEDHHYVEDNIIRAGLGSHHLQLQVFCRYLQKIFAGGTCLEDN